MGPGDEPRLLLPVQQLLLRYGRPSASRSTLCCGRQCGILPLASTPGCLRVEERAHLRAGYYHRILFLRLVHSCEWEQRELGRHRSLVGSNRGSRHQLHRLLLRQPCRSRTRHVCELRRRARFQSAMRVRAIYFRPALHSAQRGDLVPHCYRLLYCGTWTLQLSRRPREWLRRLASSVELRVRKGPKGGAFFERRRPRRSPAQPDPLHSTDSGRCQGNAA
mmetsp:Transcript_82554/g.200296  ORF Transcript_82554/g.200296 Transcript_82554/m.200296 type:complete len:220 (+) Transcript_82554:890-1549(+)